MNASNTDSLLQTLSDYFCILHVALFSKMFKKQSYFLRQRNGSFARRDGANDVRQAGHCVGGGARAGASVVRQPGVAQVVEQYLAQRGIRNFLCRLRRLKCKTRLRKKTKAMILIFFWNVRKVETEWQLKEQFLVDDVWTAMNTDGQESAHPLVDETVDSPSAASAIFDSISYSKGFEICRYYTR